MRVVNNQDASFSKSITLPQAYAFGTTKSASVGSHCKCLFVDDAPCNDPVSERCNALWRAVIVQQIMDAKTTSRNPEKCSLKSRALEWLFHDESDFAMVCDLAGWEPDYVRWLCLRAQKHGFCRPIDRSRKKIPQT